MRTLRVASLPTGICGVPMNMLMGGALGGGNARPFPLFGEDAGDGTIESPGGVAAETAGNAVEGVDAAPGGRGFERLRRLVGGGFGGEMLTLLTVHGTTSGAHNYCRHRPCVRVSGSSVGECTIAAWWVRSSRSSWFWCRPSAGCGPGNPDTTLRRGRRGLHEGMGHQGQRRRRGGQT